MTPPPSDLTSLVERVEGEPSAEWRDKSRFIYIPLNTATRPVNGHCTVDHWWAVHPTKGVAYYYRPFGYGHSDSPAPQCNRDESITRYLAERYHPNCEVKLIPVVFDAHATRAMNRDRAALRALTPGAPT